MASGVLVDNGRDDRGRKKTLRIDPGKPLNRRGSVSSPCQLQLASNSSPERGCCKDGVKKVKVTSSRRIYKVAKVKVSTRQGQGKTGQGRWQGASGRPCSAVAGDTRDIFRVSLAPAQRVGFVAIQRFAHRKQEFKDDALLLMG